MSNELRNVLDGTENIQNPSGNSLLWPNPVSLPDQHFQLIPNMTCNLFGWGQTETGRQSAIAKHALMEPVTAEICNQDNHWNRGQIDDQSEFCARPITKGRQYNGQVFQRRVIRLTKKSFYIFLKINFLK